MRVSGHHFARVPLAISLLTNTAAYRGRTSVTQPLAQNGLAGVCYSLLQAMQHKLLEGYSAVLSMLCRGVITTSMHQSHAPGTHIHQSCMHRPHVCTSQLHAPATCMHQSHACTSHMHAPATCMYQPHVCTGHMHAPVTSTAMHVHRQ